MKLHLPKGLRNAVMTCIAAVGGIATTCATATLATGIASIALSASMAYATDYTPDDITGVSLSENDTIILNNGASIGSAEGAATLTFAENNGGVTLSVTGSGTSIWNVSNASFNGNAGVSTVNIGQGAALKVYNTDNEFCAFNRKSGASLTINLAENATLYSIHPIFGWGNNNSLSNPGARTINMGNGSTWDISQLAIENEWLNKTTINMAGATIRIGDGKVLNYERFENKIVVLADASQKSVITGGKIYSKSDGSTHADSTVGSYSGNLIEVQKRNGSAADETDLLLESAITGNYKLLKGGSGIMEVTSGASDFTATFYVVEGTLKLSGADGKVGTGAIEVASGATLQLAHSAAATTSNNITLNEGATLKVGSNETLSGTSSLLGTIVLGGAITNTGAITLGASTVFDISSLSSGENDAFTLITGSGSITGYSFLTASNITGGIEGANYVFSLGTDGTLTVAISDHTPTDLYWNSGNGTWNADSTYSNGTDDAVTAYSNDTIIFDGGDTTLTLGSNISNAVKLTNNALLTLTEGDYSLQGAVDIAEGSTLTIADTFSGVSGSDILALGTASYTGEGKIVLTCNNSDSANHNIKVNLPSFNGEVAISGRFNLGLSEIGENAHYNLNNVNVWTNGNATIANDITVGENVVIRPTGTYTFTGVVSGKEVTISNANAANAVFSNSASSIEKVYVESGRQVTYNGTATNDSVFFTGDTYAASGATVTLTPSGTGNSNGVGGARRYDGAIYLNGTADSVANLVFTDGSMNITGGLHIGGETESGKAGSVVMSWAKHEYINGLYGTDGTLTVTRQNQTGYTANANARYFVLTGSGDFTGTLNLHSSMEGDYDLNFGAIVLGEENSANALKGTVVNFTDDSETATALVFKKTDTIAENEKNIFTGDTFQTEQAADGTVAGLSGSNGTVFAKQLTISGSGDYSYSGGLEIASLIVDIRGGGTQTFSGDMGGFTGDISLTGGTLAITGDDGLAISGTRHLSVKQGTTLNSNLSLSGGTLTVTAVADSAATSLAQKALTLGGGTSLVLDGWGNASIDANTQIALFTNVDSLLGSNGTALNLGSGGTDYSAYFSSITGLSDEAKAAAKLAFANGTLYLTFADLAIPDWVWDNAEGTRIWASDNIDNWDTDSGATSTDGQHVYFTGNGQGEVKISGTVTPSDIDVTNGSYTFISNGGANDQIALGDSGTLNITGSGATVTLGSANIVASGTINLQDGKLVLGADNALAADASLVFGGGLLSYAEPGEGATWTDFNNRITATGASKVRVEVQGADNAVVWGTTDSSTGLRSLNSGVNAALVSGIEKSGEGTLTLAWYQNSATDADVNNANISGNIVVSGGSLVLQGQPDNTLASIFDFTGNISVARGANFTFDSATLHSDRFLFNGSFSGEGTVDLGKSTSGTPYAIVKLKGDNSEFHGTWRLWGTGVAPSSGSTNKFAFDSVSSLGAEDATLELHGVYFYTVNSNSPTISQNIHVASSSNYYGGSSTGSNGYTFTGTLTGEAGTTLKSSVNNNAHRFTGNISGFYGIFENGGDTCTITLGGEGIASAGGEGNASVINAQYLYGMGTYIINYSDDTILNSAVGTNNGTGVSSTNLTHAGSGKLILANAGSLSTQALTLNNNTVQIGYVDGEGTVHNGNWAGTVAQASGTTGTLELVAGSLNSGTALDNYTGNVVVNVGSGDIAEGQSATFDYGDNSTARLTSVSVNGDKGSQLTNIGSFTVGGSSTCTTLNAIFGTGNIGTSATMGSGSTSLISQTSGSGITLQGGAGTTINMTIDAIVDLLKEHKDANSKSYLYLTDGSLTLNDMGAVTFGSEANILEQLGIRFVGVEGGALVLSGIADGMYIASADDAASQTISGYNTMNLFKAVAVEGGTTLTFTLAGAPGEGMDTSINNLMGGTDSRFVVNNTSSTETAVVTLNNALMSGIDSPDGYEDWAPDGSAGADTTFAGSISTTGGDVQFIKTGSGTLTVGGDLVASALELAEGGITLQGQGSEIETLTDSGTMGGMSLRTLTVSGKLTLTGSGDAASRLDNFTFLEGTGTLALKGATLYLSNGASIDGLALELDKDSMLDLDTTDGGRCELSDLSGEGRINSHNYGNVAVNPVQDATFSGSLTGAGVLGIGVGGFGAYVPDSNGTQTFSGVQGSGWSVENMGNLVLQNGVNGETNDFSSLTLFAESTTTLLVSSASAEVFTLTGDLVVEDDATIRVETADSENFNGLTYTLGSAAGLVVEGGYDLELGVGFMRYDAGELQATGGKIVLTLTKMEKNLFKDVADSHNACAGAELLWNADVVGTQDLKGISDAVEAAITYGNRAEANRLMAAAAGASIATLGSAFSSDVDRQLRAIRNRTTVMGVNQCQVNEDMPYFNAWVNAEGDYRKVEKDGTAAGYTLNSWGGTVGFDVDVNPSLTAGLALTAMYGDIDTDGPDRAEGDLDTYYVSLFARYASRAWTHTFIATVGVADASLDRTVNYGGGSYKTTGDTEGVGFGLMYEVGYVIPLNEDATTCIQPVFNVAWRHTSINSYTESGSDAALHADDQTMDVVTFGLGARFQSAIAENLYNRTALFEARALFKVDAGDRKSDLDVALLQGGACGNIESSELGAVGVELGAGLTIPVGSGGGSLFLDGSAELRSGYTNLNGTVGYRINF